MNELLQYIPTWVINMYITLAVLATFFILAGYTWEFQRGEFQEHFELIPYIEDTGKEIAEEFTKFGKIFFYIIWWASSVPLLTAHRVLILLGWMFIRKSINDFE